MKYHHSNNFIEEALANALKCLGYQSVNVVAISTKQFYVIMHAQWADHVSVACFTHVTVSGMWM